MKTLCGLLTVLMILGSLGMGMMFAVDTMQMEDANPATHEDDLIQSDNHGTRSHPEEGPLFIQLFLHRSTGLPGVSGPVINTTNMEWANAVTASADITFNLEEALYDELQVTDPTGEPGMRIVLYLSGVAGATISISVRDNDGGTLVGQRANWNLPTSSLSPVAYTIDIPFEASHNHNYTFGSGKRVSVALDFTGNIILTYDSADQPAYLRLYCLPVTDIGIKTYNFNNEQTNKFYPNNIDFPDNRREINVKGDITDVFNKWDRKYIRSVDIEFQYPGGGGHTDNATYERGSVDNRISRYSYTWEYPAGTTSGKYKILVKVIDEQDKHYTSSYFFNMTFYGVRMTSPDQEGGEGSYTAELAKAKRNVIQYSTTRYLVNIYNVGNNKSTILLDTTGPTSGWDWWFEGSNLTTENQQMGEVPNLFPGINNKMSVWLVVDSKDRSLGSKATIVVTATCKDKPAEEGILTTVTTVVVKYDVDMAFADGTKTQTSTIEVGEEKSYDFRVTNSGGADDVIYFSLSALPSGWTETMSGEELKKNHPDYGEYYVELISGDQTELTLTLTTASAGQNMELTIDIIGRSWNSKEQNDVPIVSDQLVATIILTTGIQLEVIGTSEKEVDPDDAVNFELKLTNIGSNQADYTVYLTLMGVTNGWDDGDISFESGLNVDEKQYTLGAGDSSSFFVWAEPTLDVLAKNYSIQVHAERDDDPTVRFADKTVYVIVREFNNIVVTSSLDQEGKAKPGEDVQYTVTIENRGNVAEWVTILVTVPKGWTVDFGNASSEWSKEIQPGDTEQVTVTLGVPDDAEGDETVDVTISVVPASSKSVQVLTRTKIDAAWYQPIFMLLVPIGLFIAIIVLVAVIFKRR